ncbi:MAG: SAM-dependent methyltransferase [Bradymonadia bacterium]|jgi:SAM-dependent methyltransferase
MKNVTKCRSCGNDSLPIVLDLGETPLANALQDSAHETPTVAPLVVAQCDSCSLVQLTTEVDREVLFGDYVYFSSYSDTTLASARTLVERHVEEAQLTSEHLVIELASNDGYLLKHYVELGIPVLGVEPAANIAEVARAAGVPTVCEFFDDAVAARLVEEQGHATVVHANNVLAHVSDLDGFVRGIRTLLSPEGVAYIECPYLCDLVDGVEFDTIYHEHLCYFSLRSLTALFGERGLTIVDVERLPVHGGSLRLRVARSTALQDHTIVQTASQAQHVEALQRTETALGVGRVDYMDPLAERIVSLRDSLKSLLDELPNGSVAAYGASAKSTTLLHAFGLGRDRIDWIADRSPMKQGKHTPGTGIPIVAPEQLASEMPDFTLLLCWNFATEVLAQQQAYRDAGGKFIIPIPELRVV